MDSGVSPLGRSDEKKFNRKARGVQKFAGKADVKGALKFYKSASREANSQMNYHSSDSLALSILVEDIAKSLANYFQERLYNQFGESGHYGLQINREQRFHFQTLQWTTRDWVNFGQFLLTQKKGGTCLGNSLMRALINL